MTDLVLASASPRRRELLARLGLEFRVSPADIDERPLPGEEPAPYVERLAREKAEAVRERVGPEPVVVAADTTVTVDGHILGKPDDDAHAAELLARLSGRTHQVHTGVAVAADEDVVVAVETTDVTMHELSPARIAWYVGTGEPRGKAGAYAVQGAGALLVARIDGSVTNVIGLPLGLLDDLLARVGVALPPLGAPS